MLASRCSLALIFVLGGFLPWTQAQFDPKPEDYAEWVDIILDPTIPLPTCIDTSVFEALGCQALCVALGDEIDVDNTRDVNGLYVCACSTLVGCSDRPTCEQLNIFPGTVETTCADFCGDQFVAVEDEVQYAGGLENANKNLTHFIVECRCDGDTKCSDFLLFSDLTYPSTCSSISVLSDDDCGLYCSTEGGGLFDLGHNYTVQDDGKAICLCLGTDTLGESNQAQACSDIPVILGPDACTLQDPCPTPAPVASPTSSEAPNSTPTDENEPTDPATRNTIGTLASTICGMVVLSVLFHRE